MTEICEVCARRSAMLADEDSDALCYRQLGGKHILPVEDAACLRIGYARRGAEIEALKKALATIAVRGCECICDDGCCDRDARMHEECSDAGHYACSPHLAQAALNALSAQTTKGPDNE